MKTMLRFGLLALVACSTSAPSLVIIHVNADPGVQDASRSYTLRVEGRAAGGEFREEFLETHQGWGRDFTIGPRDHDASRSYRVTLIAYSLPNADGVVVAQNVLVSGYVQSQTRRYELFLYDACQGSTCGDDERCDILGQCLPAEIPPTNIPAFDAGAGTDGGTPMDSGTLDSCDSPAMSHVSVGQEFSCALSLNGDVYCWGNNSHGQIGSSNIGSTLGPTRIALPGDDEYTITKVQAGQEHVCALTDEGAVWCWGNNNSDAQNRLGARGAAGPHLTLGEGVSDIGVGHWHACAATDEGMQCWGQNRSGELGRNNRTEDQEVGPTAPNPRTDSTRVLTGLGNSCGYTPGADLPNCWGYEQNGAVGAPVPDRQGWWTHRVVRAADATSVLTMSATHTETEPACRNGMDFHGTSCGVFLGPTAPDVRLYCWGSNGCSQIGNGRNTRADEPQVVGRAMFPATSTDPLLAVGGGTTCVARREVAGANRELYCWGDGRNMKLPGGVQVASADTAPLLMNDVDDVSVGTTHICAVANERVYCWGGNENNRAVFNGDAMPIPDPTCVSISVLTP